MRLSILIYSGPVIQCEGLHVSFVLKRALITIMLEGNLAHVELALPLQLVVFFLKFKICTCFIMAADCDVQQFLCVGDFYL
mmetsp:Transcript_30490/g.55833  ORF Transcript_30490/g.55833 Transcript_30490/m.55833 type:complete len:81 (-) Transcript_30490:1293-1535(-)